MTNSYDFSFDYLNNPKSGKIEGYIHLGKDFIDEGKSKKNMVISSPISGQLFWNIKCQI